MKPQIIDGRFALPAIPIHEGAHGKLFKGTDLQNDNQSVAVKIFRPSRYLDDRVLQTAWSNELNAYQRLGDQGHLAVMIEWGKCEDGAPYLVFEWLEKDLLTSLTDLAIEGWDDFWPIAEGILTGLSVLHSAGFVHRDLKPENILAPESGGYKIADFGTTRLAETVNVGMTVATLGTVPYSPPERGTPAPTPAYDIYSFAVLSTACLTGSVPGDDEGLRALYETLDFPPDIDELLRECLAPLPDDRPQTAGQLLALLRAIQGPREARRAGGVEIFLYISEAVLNAYKKEYGRPISSQEILEDISPISAFAFKAPTKPLDLPDLQISGQTIVLRAQEHRVRVGMLHVARILRVNGSRQEEARSDWLRPNVKLRLTAPVEPKKAQDQLEELLDRVRESDSNLRASASAAEAAFPIWRSTLKAKMEVERQRGRNIEYQSFIRDGSRVRFKISGAPEVEIGQGRLVHQGRKRLYGEVEGLENGELILFVTKGDISQLSKRGTIELDTEASRSKLRREERALERVSSGLSVRADLKRLLIDPGTSRIPEPMTIAEFVQPDLDAVKREAVEASLGANDFLLVQGPPGTGKTTFIAELVAQQLAVAPGLRILLTSQTHIALDNALVKIRALKPDANLLRLGRAERLGEEVGTLSVPEQMSKWREDVGKQSRSFLKDHAISLGVTTVSGEVREVADDVGRRSARATDLRSRIALRQAEKRSLTAEIERLKQLAVPILEAAASVEAASVGNPDASLSSAAQRFIEAGLKFAEELDNATKLSSRLVEVDLSLAEWRRELEGIRAQQQALTERLRSLLGVPAATETDALLKLANEAVGTVDPRLAKMSEIADDWHERLGRDADFSSVLIARAQVVAATCVGLTGVPGAESVSFDLCIVDEASKATATETLIPLSQSKRWILVGDENQLPPFVEQALDDASLLYQNRLTSADIRQTLFSVLSERLPPLCTYALTHQHRMQPEIGRLVSDCFYLGALTSEPRDMSAVVERALGTPVLWIDTSKRADRAETPVNTTFRNQGEARIIASLIDRIDWVAEQVGTSLQIAILSGYDAQRREIMERLAAHENSRHNLQVRVASVDSYQGQEADISIFSVTRSNNTGSLGFLKHKERINVALSRARDGLVIVGDARFIESSNSNLNPLHDVHRYILGHPACKIEEPSDD